MDELLHVGVHFNIPANALDLRLHGLCTDRDRLHG